MPNLFYMGKRFSCWVGLLNIFFCFQAIRGQQFNPVFRSYSNAEGLSQSVVMSVFQDSKDFMWFGTEDGLNKFDGYNFKIYRYDPDDSASISDNWIENIALEDTDGDLWIYTADRTINVFSPKYENFRKIVPDEHKRGTLLPFNNFYFVFQDRSGKIWLSTDRGLFTFDKHAWSFSTVFRNTDEDHPRKFYNFFEDNNQNIWFGSNKGLVIWNMKKQNIITDYSTGNNSLKGLILGARSDNTGNIWVATEDNVFSFNNRARYLKAFPHKPGKSPNNEAGKKKLLRTQWVNMDKNNNLWIISSNGLMKFNTKTTDFQTYAATADKSSLSSNDLTVFYEDKLGGLWFGTENGLNKYIPRTNSFVHYFQKKKSAANDGIFRIFEDKNGRIWTLDWPLQGEASHLSYLDTKESSLVYVAQSYNGNQTIPIKMIYPPFIDRQGNVWLGTYGSGVLEYTPFQKQFEVIKNYGWNKNSIQGNSTWSISEDSKGRLWFALFQDGLDCYDPVTRNITHYTDKLAKFLGLNSLIVCSTVTDNNNKVWVGIKDHGLVSIDIITDKMAFFTNDSSRGNYISGTSIYSLTKDLSGNILISYANSGIDIFNPHTGKVKNYQKIPGDSNSLISASARYAIQASDGKYWISTDGAISVLDPVTSKFTHYKSKKVGGNGILVDKAGYIFEDSKKNIWIGTHGLGLVLFDNKKKEFRYWDEKKGLVNNVIYCILEDENHKLWLSTNNGLSCFDPTTEKFKNYYANDGLSGSEFNMNTACRTHNGKMYFGGIDGVTAFFPSEIKVDQVPPQVSITGLQIFNKKVEVLPYSKRQWVKNQPSDKIIELEDHLYLENNISYTTTLRLDYDYKVFTFEFSALKFDMPERCTFMYKMEGFEKDWNLAGNRRYASYTNLPPGQYVFEVTAANADGIWNPKPAKITIIIKPPFYLTWWFISLVTGLLIVAVFSFIRQREKQLKRTKLVLEKNVKQRTQELNAKNEELTLRNIQILKQKEEIANQAKRLKVDMDIQHQASELALLRNQVNPHFLFNTLNNIYSLVYQKSSEAPEALMKLSDIMRYMLYETASDKVLLEKEIDYLKSFIDLQLLRLKSREFVQFEITGDPSGKIIAPMLLIPFVENAFKHGNKTVLNPGIIIKLDCKPNSLSFYVMNSKRIGGSKDCVGGIGLTNVKRRLDLIYHDKFSLDILDSENKFEINLVINEI
jgi:ligand-binding sensor domain-containing protein